MNFSCHVSRPNINVKKREKKDNEISTLFLSLSFSLFLLFIIMIPAVRSQQHFDLTQHALTFFNWKGDNYNKMMHKREMKLYLVRYNTVVSSIHSSSYPSTLYTIILQDKFTITSPCCTNKSSSHFACSLQHQLLLSRPQRV
jgi:hypothetical protein